MNRGSLWRKWDLHVHTPFSYINSFKSWDDYISKLNEVTKKKDIKVLGITDYFSIEGYEEIITKYRSKLENVKLLLPNIEFRLDNIVYRRNNREPKRLNFHVIFSNEVETKDVKNQFLGDLHFYKGSGNAGELSKIKLEKSAIERYGKECRQQKEFKNDSDLSAGAKNVVFKLDEIVNTLKNKPEYFKGKYLLFLESEFWSDIDWGQDYGLRKTLLQVSHGIFDSNPNDIKWFLGLDTNYYSSQQEFIKEFGRLFPCIHGSDAHKNEELETRPDSDRYCWIKADPTFEGLKQIIYEPEERVRIQPENPEPRKNIYTLDFIKIQNSCISDELSIEEQEILLNRNLITVTGGKGSGKTALLDLIANCFEDRCKRSGEDKNSFIQRIEDQKKDLEVEIGFIGEDIKKFSKKLVEEKFFGDSRVTYLPQGKIEEYSGNRQKLHKKIEEIIFSNKDVIDGGYKQKFDEIRDKIDEITKQIDEINREIYKFEEDTKEEIIVEITSKKRIKEGELKDKRDELGRLTESMEEDIKESIEKLKKEEMSQPPN